VTEHPYRPNGIGLQARAVDTSRTLHELMFRQVQSGRHHPAKVPNSSSVTSRAFTVAMISTSYSRSWPWRSWSASDLHAGHGTIMPGAARRPHVA
jgi:hypothetical protein